MHPLIRTLEYRNNVAVRAGPWWRRPYHRVMDGTKLFDMSVNGRSLAESFDEYLVINEDPEAHQLADLVSIRSDLDGASAACALFAEEAQKGDDAGTSRLRIFFEAAVISYARPFTKGKGSGKNRQGRRKIDDLLTKLDQEDIRAHEQAVRIRNVHVGHRVDPDEQSAVVLAAFDRQTYKFKSVSPMMMDRIDAGVIWGLSRCAKVLVDLVEAEISKEMDELTNIYQTQDDDQCLQLPQALTALGPKLM